MQANYTGEVSKTDCQVVTYTATFGSVEAPGESNAPAADDPSASADPDKPAVPFNWAEVKTPLMIGGMVLILAIGGAFAIKKIRRR